MNKFFTGLTVAAASLMLTFPVVAQENLLAGKTVSTLGQAKTWTAGDESYTFITDDLAKLVQEPANTTNVFLYPENATLNTEENQALGAQGFYIDMGTSQAVGTVYTTWEGAAADSYDIYLTDEVPTLSILSTTPTYSITGLGQYQENTAVLDGDVSGRYLVFQVTKATNWGWGVKIRSISAQAPADDVLTTFKVSPSIVAGTEQTPVTLTLLNQFGLVIPENNVGITVSDNAVYENGNLTILSGNSAVFTATLGGETLEATVYMATAPSSPAATAIKTPIYTNSITGYNNTAEFTTAYNGGANNIGELNFADGEVAWLFGDARCIFFSNSETTGAWNGSINPEELGYRNLFVDVFSGIDTNCTIEFESVENLEGGHTYPFALAAGEWTTLKVDVAGATKLGNLSIRFTEADKADILLSNIYFSPTYVEGDENAPELGDVTATPFMTSVQLSFSATDDLSEDVYYSISDGTRTFTLTGASGETIFYVLNDLQPATTYNITVSASDGLNISDPKELTVTTLGIPDAATPSVPTEQVLPIYSNAYGATELPSFSSWDSKGIMSTTTTESGNTVLLFSNYLDQWGGLVDLNINATGADKLCIDIFSESEGSLTIAPVWADANGATTPNYTLQLEAGQWNSFNIPLSEFGYDNYGTTIIQLALTNSGVASFIVDNLYLSGDTTLAVGEITCNDSENVDIYNVQGVCIMRNVKISEVIDHLPSGLYIAGGKKIMKK